MFFSTHRATLLSVLVLIVAPLLGQSASLLTGLSSNPIWTVSGVVSGVGPQMVAGWPFGDPNVGWTNQALGKLAAIDWLHGRIPWWNPYSGIGLPLAGEMQPAAMFLPFVLLLAFQNGIFWLELVLQSFAGLMTFALLRQMGFGRATSIVGALLYEFNGTFQAVPGETILNVIPFLPLLLLGIERARTSGDHSDSRKNPREGRTAIVLIACGIGGSILGGFPEAAYIDGLMALLWATFRLYADADRLRFIRRVAIGGILGLFIAGPQIIAFTDFAALTDIFQTHTIGNVFLNIHAMAQIIVPHIYGPLGTNLGNNLLLQIAGGTGGYVGVLSLIFAAFGALTMRDRPIAVLLVIWILLSLGKMFGFEPVMTMMNALPFMKDTEFFRYSSPAWELAAVILIAGGLDNPTPQIRTYLVAVVAGLFLIGLCVALAWPWLPIWHWSSVNLAYMIRWIVMATAFQLAAIAFTTFIWLRIAGPRRQALLGGTLVVYTMAMMMLPQLSGQPPGKIDWPAIKFLKSHLGLQRFYTVGPIQPNYSAYFEIANINHNYLPVALNWSRYVETHLFPSAASQNGGIFWAPFPPMKVGTAIADLHRFATSYQFLGVRYVVADPGQQMSPSLTLPSEAGQRSPERLYRGDGLTWHLVAPAAFSHLGTITRISFFQGNYGNTASGVLATTVCADDACSSGQRNLSQSADNSMFRIPLNPPLVIKPGDQLTITVTHTSGNHPDALWLPPAPPGKTTLTTNSGEILPDRSLLVSFDTQSNQTGFQRVYRDKLMSIWEQHGADPYYTTSGSSCSLQDQRRNALVATCTGAARLVRRELFMPGWHATVNAHQVAITPDHGIVQSIDLKQGRNRIAFHFTPPFEPVAWILFWFSVASLVWLIVPRRAAGSKTGPATPC